MGYRWPAAVLVVAWLGLGCSDNPPIGPDPDAPFPPIPDVRVTLEFDDAPLAGEIVIDPGDEPPSRRNAWRYAADLNEDPEIEASGIANELISLPYRFDQPGVHNLRVIFDRGGIRQIVDRKVVVNDPEGFEVLTSTSLQPGTVLEGIAFDRTGDTVFVSKAAQRTIFRLAGDNLSVIDSFWINELTNTLEGLATAPDEDVLYVMSKRFQLLSFSYPAFSLLSSVQVSGKYFVHAGTNRRVLVGGGGGDLTLVDARSGEVLSGFSSFRIGHFEVARDGDVVAIERVFSLENQESAYGIVRLTAETLNLDWRVPWPSGRGRPIAIAIVPTKNRVYVVGDLNGICRLFVLDASNGTDLSDSLLGSCPDGGITPGVANPVAATPDHRFIAFPTTISAFIVDTEIDLPRYRIDSSPGFDFCCNVAAHPTRNEFYFAGLFQLTVTRVHVGL